MHHPSDPCAGFATRDEPSIQFDRNTYWNFTDDRVLNQVGACIGTEKI